MGSVMDWIECPQCGGSMFTEHYYKTSEEYWMCRRCGKHGKVELIRDEDGEVILDKQGKVDYKAEDIDGFGCAKIAIIGHGASFSCFNKPITEEDKKAFFETLKEKKVDKERSYLSFWNEETQKVEMLYGEDPTPFEEDEEL